MNEIVKYSNCLNNIGLKNFTSNQFDMLMAICSKLKDKKSEEVVLDFVNLKELIKLNKNYTNAEFINELIDVNRKLLALNFRIETQDKIIQFNLFSKFEIDRKNLCLTVAVNSEFSFLLNTLTSNFTRFELEEYVELNSCYSKEFYRRMKQYKATGIWIVNIDEFKNLLNVPSQYRVSDIDAWVLSPIQKELGDKYNLKITKNYEKQKRGRPSVKGYTFKFDTNLGNIVECEEIETKKTEDKNADNKNELLKQFFETNFAEINYNKSIRLTLEKLLKNNSLDFVKSYLTDTYNSVDKIPNIQNKNAYFSKLIIEGKRIAKETDKKLFSQEEKIDEYEGKTEDDFIQANLFGKAKEEKKNINKDTYSIAEYKKFFEYVKKDNKALNEFLESFNINYSKSTPKELHNYANDLYSIYYNEKEKTFDEFFEEVLKKNQKKKVYTIDDIPQEKLLSKKGKKLTGIALQKRAEKILEELNSK